MNNPKTLKIKVVRAELRNRKIIIVLEPDLLTCEEFAVNPFYNEGLEKNKIQEIRIGVWLTEKNGNIKVETAEYNGTHYTTGHTQIHYLNGMYLNKKDCAIAEIKKTEFQYIEDESRMNKLLCNWNDFPEFQKELIDLINNRKAEHQKNKLKQALNEYEGARKRLEKIMFKTKETSN